MSRRLRRNGWKERSICGSNSEAPGLNLALALVQIPSATGLLTGQSKPVTSPKDSLRARSRCFRFLPAWEARDSLSFTTSETTRSRVRRVTISHWTRRLRRAFLDRGQRRQSQRCPPILAGRWHNIRPTTFWERVNRTTSTCLRVRPASDSSNPLEEPASCLLDHAR